MQKERKKEKLNIKIKGIRKSDIRRRSSLPIGGM